MKKKSPQFADAGKTKRKIGAKKVAEDLGAEIQCPFCHDFFPPDKISKCTECGDLCCDLDIMMDEDGDFCPDCYPDEED